MKLELKIICFLAKNAEEALTMNEIAKRLDQHYSFVNRVIRRLADEQAIILTKVGSAYACAFNHSSEKAFALLSLAEIENKDSFLGKNKQLKPMLEDLIKALNKAAKNGILAIVLFGSHAKNLSTPKSDIDVLVIAKQRFSFGSVSREFYATSGIEANLLLLTEKEFKAQRDNELIAEILKYHYVLQGAEEFVRQAFK